MSILLMMCLGGFIGIGIGVILINLFHRQMFDWVDRITRPK